MVSARTWALAILLLYTLGGLVVYVVSVASFAVGAVFAFVLPALTT